MSDQDKISPYSIGTIWRRQVMRIKKNTYQGIVIWSNTKFSKVTLWKNCLSGRMENYYWDLGSERVNWKFECYCTKEEPIQELRVYWSVIDIGCNFLVSSCALISLTFNGSSLNIENIPKIYDRGFLFTWFCEFHGGKSCIDFFHLAVWSVNGLSMHLGALCRLKFHSWEEACYAWSHWSLGHLSPTSLLDFIHRWIGVGELNRRRVDWILFCFVTEVFFSLASSIFEAS